MVVLSASVLGKNGKVLVARQFVDMSRIRIEGLLAAFPKLIGTNSQHTFIDTESVRYVYQPMEQFFLLLITNKASNIVEDLETLRLLSKVVPDVAGGLNEDVITDKCFELVFAFDEVINAGGYSEHINLQQIRTNLEMESHEEKLQMMIRQSKEDTAKEEMRRKAQAIREEQREREKLARAAGLRPTDPYASSAGSGMGAAGAPGGGFGGAGGYGASSFQSASGFGSASIAPPTIAEPAPAAPKPSTSARGMQLGKSKKAMDFVSALAAEDNLQEPPPLASTKIQQVATPAPVLSNDPVSLAVEEKISVSLNREGALQSMELKGTLSLLVNDQAAAKCKVHLRAGDNSGISIQTHPKMDKALYEKEQVLMLKDSRRGFPESKVGVLKWSLKSADESLVPFTINCWPEEEGPGQFNVNIEYSLERPELVLRNVDIMIPLRTTNAPEIVSVDGVHLHNQREGILMWHLDQIDDSNSTGSIEFNIKTASGDSFFPVTISFLSQTPFCSMDIAAVKNVESGADIPFGFTKQLSSEVYTVN